MLLYSRNTTQAYAVSQSFGYFSYSSIHNAETPDKLQMRYGSMTVYQEGCVIKLSWLIKVTIIMSPFKDRGTSQNTEPPSGIEHEISGKQVKRVILLVIIYLFEQNVHV